MSSRLYTFAAILVLVSVKCVEPAVFCDNSVQNIETAFNVLDDIYLVSGQDVWIANIFIDDGRPDPTSFTIKQLFKGLEIKKLMAGFMVELIPKGCDRKTEEEKCRFLDYMLNTSFIFYQMYDNSLQVYSMMRWDPHNLNFKFDDQIGGYGHMLRANRSYVRSAWPGATPGSKVVGTLFDVKTNSIYLFARTDTNLEVHLKKLDHNWDQSKKANTFPLSDMVGCFRKGQHYYFLTKDNLVYKFTSDFLSYEKNGANVKAFFDCI